MDYTFWVPLVVNLAGLYLTQRQVRIMESQSAIGSPVQGAIKIAFLKRYWPIGFMTVLMLFCWIPYFIAKPQNSEIFLGWGSNNGKIWAVVKTDDLVSVKPDRLMLIARIGDIAVDYKTDSRIARSATFEILAPSLAMQVNPAPEFLSRMLTPVMVDVFVLQVPRDFPVEAVKSLADAERLGGKIIGSHSVNANYVPVPGS